MTKILSLIGAVFIATLFALPFIIYFWRMTP
jgi:hypothetical protein